MRSIIVTVAKRHKKRKCLAESFAIFVLLCGIANVQAQTVQPPLLTVLDFGSTPIAKLAADTIRSRMRSTGKLVVADADLSRAGARGIGYAGSLNLTTTEARDL